MTFVLTFAPCDTVYPYISLNIATSTAPFLANSSEKKLSAVDSSLFFFLDTLWEMYF